MKFPVRPVALAVGLCLGFAAVADESASPAAIEPAAIALDVRIEDTQRFFRLYEASNGQPTAEQIESDYLQPGTPALHKFIRSRDITAEKLAEAIAKRPKVFEDAKRCAARLPTVKQRVEADLRKLAQVHPPSRFPPVTMVVGVGKTGGTTTSSGVVIGVETICLANWLQPDIGDRMVHLIAHEYAHIQQPHSTKEHDDSKWTVLHHTLVEGGAGFVAELISGQVSAVHLHEWAKGRECAIQREFLEDANGTDKSRWLYNGLGDEEWKGDLGYWVGYQIANAYYDRAQDKQQALADILGTTPETSPALFEASGWAPCPGGVVAASASQSE